MKSSKKFLRCRLCDSKVLEIIFDFGKVPLGNNLQSNLKGALSAKTYPLQVFRCKKCFHFQLGYSVSPDILYATNYTYLSSVGVSFVNHIKKFVYWIENKCKISKEQFVFEIGSNDGTCLKEFNNLIGCKVVGVDPAEIPCKLANESGIKTFNEFFSNITVETVKNNFGQPDLIISQNALAHIDDLKKVFENVFLLLKDKGYFAFEVGYFGKVLEKNLFDTIYHEHLDYHHAFPLVKILKKIGFSLINISLNNSQGGSVRLLLKKGKTKIISEQVKNFLMHEKNSLLYNENYLINWQVNIQKNLQELKNQILNIKKLGVPIIGYGAPTKATLLLEIASITKKEVDFIIEDNKLKIGKYLPRHGIKIKSSNELRKFKKLCVVILAWNFASDILDKLKKLKLEVIVLIPLPKLKIVKL